MDVGFEGFGTADFDVEIEDIEVKKAGKFDRLFKIREGGSICYTLLRDNRLYFGACDGYVYAMDAGSGEELWRFKTGGVIVGRCALEGGKLFAGSYDGRVYAIDAGSGKELWRYKTGGEIYGGPAAHEGKVYFGSNDGSVYCLNAKTGKEIWRFRTGDWAACAPLVHDNKVYTGSFDSYFYCIDAESGKEIWRFRTGDHVLLDLPPLLHEGKVYFASFDNYLYCLDCETGKEVWRFKTGKYGNNNAPVVYENMLIQGTRDGILYAITMEGKEIWRFKAMGEGILTKASVKNDRIYFGTESNNLYVLDLDGKEISRFRAGGFVYDPPNFFGNFALFASWDCHIYCVDIKTMKETWRFTTSTVVQAVYPPPYKGWKAEVKKQTHIEDAVSEEKYKKKKDEESVSLSDYHVASEYATTSEYKQKSDYDTSFVMFEETARETLEPQFLNKPHNLVLWTSGASR
jgi:outer membrane protein assembly factor BamB